MHNKLQKFKPLKYVNFINLCGNFAHWKKFNLMDNEFKVI